MVQCCKTLGVTTPEAAKVPPASQSLLAILPLMLTLCFDALGHQPTAVISLETGPPPRSLPFTTLVLQDCVQAHAPPRA